MSNQSIPMARSSLDDRVPLRLRLAQRGIDGVTLLVVPAALFILLLFVYPFLYGLLLSMRPKAETAGRFANYVRFFSDPFLYDTILTTLKLALPVTIINVVHVDPGRHARAAADAGSACSRPSWCYP